ncbi:hypothetical protein [uncultured Maribacter sp.]|uniref:hypothetical protein n=1 Tax=uncultured Maribacter sp. TaxID=431308 RepID=UPI002616DC8A|nr:hypothetical protein [uncultured Maribacter sp.]
MVKKRLGDIGVDDTLSLSMKGESVHGLAVKDRYFGKMLDNYTKAYLQECNLDYRNIYVSLLKEWLQTEPSSILSGKFKTLGLV